MICNRSNMRYTIPQLISATLLLAHSLSPTIRHEIINRQGKICGLCKTSFSKMIPHEIHHLNHNPKDNNKLNLLALCANCHAAHHRYKIKVVPFIHNTKN